MSKQTQSSRYYVVSIILRLKRCVFETDNLNLVLLWPSVVKLHEVGSSYQRRTSFIMIFQYTLFHIFYALQVYSFSEVCTSFNKGNAFPTVTYFLIIFSTLERTGCCVIFEIDLEKYWQN